MLPSLIGYVFLQFASETTCPSPAPTLSSTLSNPSQALCFCKSSLPAYNSTEGGLCLPAYSKALPQYYPILGMALLVWLANWVTLAIVKVAALVSRFADKAGMGVAVWAGVGVFGVINSGVVPLLVFSNILGFVPLKRLSILQFLPVNLAKLTYYPDFTR